MRSSDVESSDSYGAPITPNKSAEPVSIAPDISVPHRLAAGPRHQADDCFHSCDVDPAREVVGCNPAECQRHVVGPNRCEWLAHQGRDGFRIAADQHAVLVSRDPEAVAA